MGVYVSALGWMAIISMPFPINAEIPFFPIALSRSYTVHFVASRFG